MTNMRKYFAVLALAIGLLLASTACGFSGDQRTDPSYRTLRYEGGDFSGSKFKECMGDGEKIASNDKFYSYPTTQRQDVWDTDNFNQGTKSADHPDLQLTAKGGVTVNAKVKVDFQLNTDCDPVDVDGKHYPGGTLQAFHELIGKTRAAYFDVNKSGNSSYSGGWLWAMDTYVSVPVIGDLVAQSKTYTPDQLWQNPSVADAMEQKLMDNIEAEINEGMQTDLQFYHVAGIQIYQLTPDADYLDLFKQRQAAATKAQSAKDNKHALVTEAQTNAAVLKATIEGYRLPGMTYNEAVQAYLKAQVIENQGNPFQPNVNSLQTQ
jgi:hypothetical protein